jgi:hypothetical protein
MRWSILRASLATHDPATAGHLFGALLGLGEPRRVDGQTLAFGEGDRGLRVHRPSRALGRLGGARPGSGRRRSGPSTRR